MNDLSLPAELKTILGNEQIDFSVSAKRNQPIKKSIESIAWGIGILAFMSIFVFAFLGPLFEGKESHFTVNGIPTSASWENFQPLLIPTLIIGIIILCGLKLVIFGIYSIFQKGGFYIATSNRLIHYKKGNIKYYDWEQFTGNIELNNKKGDIHLELRKGKIVSSKNKPDQFVPEIIYISGVKEILEIEKICRQRIKENDPTPANSN